MEYSYGYSQNGFPGEMSSSAEELSSVIVTKRKRIKINYVNDLDRTIRFWIARKAI